MGKSCAGGAHRIHGGGDHVPRPRLPQPLHDCSAGDGHQQAWEAAQGHRQGQGLPGVPRVDGYGCDEDVEGGEARGRGRGRRGLGGTHIRDSRVLCLQCRAWWWCGCRQRACGGLNVCLGRLHYGFSNARLCIQNTYKLSSARKFATVVA
jgi:hypothetical protein